MEAHIMRFANYKDYATILKINKELVNVVVDTSVVLYKMHQELTEVNSYGESINKIWYVGVLIPALIKRDETQAIAALSTVDVQQTLEVAFLRTECDLRNVYPEVGDIIDFHNDYYEIDNTNEVQLYAGQTGYNHSIVCSTHLTRTTNLQLERPRV